MLQPTAVCIKQQRKQFGQTEVNVMNGTVRYCVCRIVSIYHYTNLTKYWNTPVFHIFVKIQCVRVVSVLYELLNGDCMGIDIRSGVECHWLNYFWNIFCFSKWAL